MANQRIAELPNGRRSESPLRDGLSPSSVRRRSTDRACRKPFRGHGAAGGSMLPSTPMLGSEGLEPSLGPFAALLHQRWARRR
jgi:hypothetical protein